MWKKQGSITVFLSLISVLFLSLACTLAESVRVQACRAKAAALTRMGLFSIFGEYERQVLEDYDVFFLDGACGSEEFSISRLETKAEEYMRQNTEGTSGLLSLQLKGCQIESYTLATDEQGTPFRRQAAENQRETLVFDAAENLLADSREVRRQEEAGRALEEGSLDLEQQMDQLLEEQSLARNQEEPKETEWEKTAENPLDVIRKIRKLGILSLVVKEPDKLSSMKAEESELPSIRTRREGRLKDPTGDDGWTEEALFFQYLNRHFGTMTQVRQGGGLAYELEYLLAGKSSDVENLKSVVNRLLLMREGANFLCALADGQMRQQALLLATGICGAAPVPGLRTAICGALLLAWAYGESLLEVRTLLAGGKVPLVKTSDQWKLSLQQLGNLTQLLNACDEGGGEGCSYEDYLWMLLAAGDKSAYAMRALDLAECRVRKTEEGKFFRADAAIVRARVKTQWEIPPMFFRVASAFLGTGSTSVNLEMEGIFGY